MTKFMQLSTGMTFFYATDRVVCPPLVLSLTWKAATYQNTVLDGWSYLPKTRRAAAPSLVSRPPWSLQPPPAGSKCSFDSSRWGASQSLNVKKASTTRAVDSPEQHYLQSICRRQPSFANSLGYLHVPLILREKVQKTMCAGLHQARTYGAWDVAGLS